ncbi:primosomal protein N' [Brevibacillus laterosporus]|uniref:Replication restart protein PriA n=1 Tax=Brevibacillus laterosporus LMG 15441 TaxID=1042163 RepID=A0A075R8K8_BRELA|nr:primosomal protein N' [Brevibacillus laterosporus]AIG27731.1 replication restart DNA helicase PriA [Brevibacillus laterosporus LMG 15441]RJL15620.1 primosomal protein N' [Brevibacillus laterosporus]TPH06216.1 primosomal protein N' [Brevibacillus laterosporus]
MNNHQIRAKVIVDVPATRTNRPYDYAVPLWLQPLVAVGSRVVVPFGPRKVQGYVIGLIQGQEADHDPDGPGMIKIKELEKVLDDVPPLSLELIQLAEWMSHRYLCPLTMSIAAMLPAVLKGKTEKWYMLADEVDEELAEKHPMLRYLLHQGSLLQTEADKQFPVDSKQIPKWIKNGLIVSEYQVKNRLTHKKLAHVQLAIDEVRAWELMENIPKRSYRMRDVLEFLLNQQKEQGQQASYPVKDVIEKLSITRSTLTTMQQKGWIAIEQKEVGRDPYANRTFSPPPKHILTREQQHNLAAILRSVEQEEYHSFLLHGVTGSGKTEVYMEAIEHTLAKGREAIFLVPEISLTPQMVERIKGRFGDNVAVLHSALSQGERYDEWRKILRQQVQVVVGARSAIFAPFRNLGLIIMDEEHEGSYKQEETPRYHARDVALWRAQMNNAVFIMGSATPALETYALATRGRYDLLSMKSRVGNRPLPKVHVVDMREEMREQNRSMFSRSLHQMIADRLQKQEQIVIFLNRRGFSTFVMCRSCGYTLACPHCDISLTYHRTNHTARCHYCGYTISQPRHCPECQSDHIRFFGTGTQKVEEELAKLFPGVRVIRMDVDTTSKKGAHEALLTKFRTGQGDILLGTQMIAKGLDFPRVTLVGVIAADTSLHLPDFRSAEKTFQLLTQVGGRAGRHELSGDVVVQTYTPEHYSIQHATHHDYEAFYQAEMVHRKKKGYPPFYRLVLITFSHEDVPMVIRAAEQYAAYLRPRLAQTTVVLGPVASPIARIKDRFRFQIMLKYRDEPKIFDLLAQTTLHFDDWMKQNKVLSTIDVDPQMLL